MDELSAKLKIVTPMFLGGADQRAERMRPPSIKAALRFWWRALAWPRFLAVAGEPAKALRDLHAREGELFGSAGGVAGQGQSRVLIEARSEYGLDKRETAWPVRTDGAGYLSIGIWESGTQARGNWRPHREGFAAKDADFVLRMLFKPGSTPADRQEVEQALRAWTLFGGLGSRSRRGFGSVQLVELVRGTSEKAAPQVKEPIPLPSRQDFEWQAREVLTLCGSVGDYPPYTAFSDLAAFGVLLVEQDPRTAVSKAGSRFKGYRGHPNMTGNRKAAFGLPLTGIDERRRRASPLFFHVHQLAPHGNDKQFAVGVLFLPAYFHPDQPHGSKDLPAFYQVARAFVPPVAGGAR